MIPLEELASLVERFGIAALSPTNGSHLTRLYREAADLLDVIHAMELRRRTPVPTSTPSSLPPPPPAPAAGVDPAPAPDARQLLLSSEPFRVRTKGRTCPTCREPLWRHKTSWRCRNEHSFPFESFDPK